LGTVRFCQLLRQLGEGTGVLCYCRTPLSKLARKRESTAILEHNRTVPLCSPGSYSTLGISCVYGIVDCVARQGVRLTTLLEKHLKKITAQSFSKLSDFQYHFSCFLLSFCVCTNSHGARILNSHINHVTIRRCNF